MGRTKESTLAVLLRLDRKGFCHNVPMASRRTTSVIHNRAIQMDKTKGHPPQGTCWMMVVGYHFLRCHRGCCRVCRKRSQLHNNQTGILRIEENNAVTWRYQMIFFFKL